MAKSFKYYEPTAEQLHKRVNSSGGGFDTFILPQYEMFTPEKGENWVRILPATWEGADHWALSVYLHYNLGPDKGTALCLNKMKRQPCPVCEYRSRMSGKLDEDEMRELRAADRMIAWTLDRNNENEGPKIWSMSVTKVDQPIARLGKDRTTGELIPLTNPDHGYDIFFDRSGEGLRTQYAGFTTNRRASSVADRHLEYVCDNPLPEVLLWRDYDEVAKLFEGTTPRKQEGKDKDRGGRDRGRDDDRGGRGNDRGRDDPPRRGRDTDDEPPRRGRDVDDAPRGRDREPDPEPRGRGRDVDDAPRGRERDADPEPRGRGRDADPDPAPRGRDRDADPEPRGRGRDEPEPRGRGRDVEPPARNQDDDPEPRRSRAPLEDPPETNTSPRSRVDELKERFKDRGR